MADQETDRHFVEVQLEAASGGAFQDFAQLQVDDPLEVVFVERVEDE